MQLDLWPDENFPGFCDLEDGKEVEELTPHLLWKPADGDSDSERITVMAIPGGGYSHRADEKFERIGDWLNELGLHAAILRYRVGPWRYPAPQHDAIRAMRLLRHPR